MRILVILLIIFVHSHITYGRLTAPSAHDTAENIPRFILPSITNNMDNVSKTPSVDDNATQNVADVERNPLVEEVNKTLGDVTQLVPTDGAEATLEPWANLIIALMSLGSLLAAPVGSYIGTVIDQTILTIISYFNFIASTLPEMADQLNKMLLGFLSAMTVASSQHVPSAA